jgi:hypothetical protein
MRYALLRAGIVETVARWDGETPWAASAEAVRIPDDVPAGPGWAYDGTTWTDVRPVPPAPTERDLDLPVPIDLPEEPADDPGDLRELALRLLLVVYGWARAYMDTGSATALRALAVVRFLRMFTSGAASPRAGLTVAQRQPMTQFIAWWQS